MQAPGLGPNQLCMFAPYLYAGDAQKVGPGGQNDKISHIDMGDDFIDTVISYIINPYPISMSRMTISIW